MIDWIVHFAVIVGFLIAATVAVESRDILRSIAAFIVMSIILAIGFFLLGAPYVAVFQLAIYAGAIAVLLLAAVHTLKGGEHEG